MNKQNEIHQISFWSLLVLAMLTNVVSQAVHETGHHIVYQLAGRGPVWGFTKLVQLWDTTPLYPDEWVEVTGVGGERGWKRLGSPVASKTEDMISTAAGPLAGLLGAALGLVIARRSEKRALRQIGLVLALNASLVAVLYYLRSPLRTGGDEYDIAVQLGTAKWTIELALGLAFALCLAFGLRQLLSWRFRLKWLGTILLGSVATGIPMASVDSLVISQVDAGNPWFRPLLGYALPVLVVNALALVGIWIWLRWQERRTVDKVRKHATHL